MGWLFLMVMGWIMTVLVIGPACMAAEHRRKQREKVALMREFPQHAGQLMQSMDDDEARFKAAGAKYFDDMGKAFNRPKRQGNGTATKLGMGLVKRLLK